MLSTGSRSSRLSSGAKGGVLSWTRGVLSGWEEQRDLCRRRHSWAGPGRAPRDGRCGRPGHASCFTETSSRHTGHPRTTCGSAFQRVTSRCHHHLQLSGMFVTPKGTLCPSAVTPHHPPAPDPRVPPHPRTCSRHARPFPPAAAVTRASSRFALCSVRALLLFRADGQTRPVLHHLLTDTRLSAPRPLRAARPWTGTTSLPGGLCP